MYSFKNEALGCFGNVEMISRYLLYLHQIWGWFHHHLTKLFYLTFTFVLFSPTVHTKRAWRSDCSHLQWLPEVTANTQSVITALTSGHLSREKPSFRHLRKRYCSQSRGNWLLRKGVDSSEVNIIYSRSLLLWSHTSPTTSACPANDVS